MHLGRRPVFPFFGCTPTPPPPPPGAVDTSKRRGCLKCFHQVCDSEEVRRACDYGAGARALTGQTFLSRNGAGLEWGTSADGQAVLRQVPASPPPKKAKRPGERESRVPKDQTLVTQYLVAE